jgi:hypothetical protein
LSVLGRFFDEILNEKFAGLNPSHRISVICRAEPDFIANKYSAAEPQPK